MGLEHTRKVPFQRVAELPPRAQVELQRNFETAVAQGNPTGTVVPWAGKSALAVPQGWLLCDGASKDTGAYPNLFAVIGYQYGGAGASFNVPNLAGRVPTGQDAAQTEFDVLGETGGSKTGLQSHSHSHTHGSHSHSHDHGLTNHTHGGGTGVHAHTIPKVKTVSSGSAHGHNNNANEVSASPDADSSFGTDVTTSSNGQTNTAQGSNDATGTTPTADATTAGTASGNLVPYIVLRYLIKT